MELIDTHAHIDGEEYADDRAEMLARAKAAGVVGIIDFADSMESAARAVCLSESEPMVFAGVGVHPGEVFPMTEADDERLAAWAESPKVVAIGEIGLDYYWEKDSERRALQREVFIRQLALARALDLPVCIHDRDAHGDMLAILKTEGRKNRGVIHCFSGSREMAAELLKLGWYLGIDGPITYKNAAKAPEVVRMIPADRILVETDSPYLSPEPFRGKRNEPARVRVTAEFAASLRGEDAETFARQTTMNARAVYALSEG